MKKPQKRRTKTHTILEQPAYWRLRADILATQDFLAVAYLQSIAHSMGQKLDPTSKQWNKLRADFDKRLKKQTAFHHGRLLEALENLSPELAASLDNRDLDEIEPT